MLNEIDKTGDTALQKYLDATIWWGEMRECKDEVLVLFAAGDSFNNKNIEVIISPLKEMMTPQMNLKDMCRHKIRKPSPVHRFAFKSICQSSEARTSTLLGFVCTFLRRQSLQ